MYENEGDSAAERGWRGSNGLAPEEVLDVAASNQDGNSGLEETGLLPRDRGWDGDAGGGHDVPPQGKGQDMKGGGGQGDGAVGTAAGERMRREGRKEDGEWDWQALRRGVADERGDVAFYDASFVEDPWRGLGGGRKPSV